jgi:hypothetical protein
MTSLMHQEQYKRARVLKMVRRSREVSNPKRSHRFCETTAADSQHSNEVGVSLREKPLVRPRRLELPRVLPHSDLNAARLPIPPRPPEDKSS